MTDPHNEALAPGAIERGATLVITHEVRTSRCSAYETWLEEIVPLCASRPGHIDTQIIRPIDGLTATYTVIIRFRTTAYLKSWLESGERKRLIEKVQPLLMFGDKYTTRSGLEFLFTAEESSAKAPVRWKQWLVTWSVIYPLVLGVPLVLVPLMTVLGLPDNHYLSVLLVTGTIVGLMVYVVMPRYTRLVHTWLFR